MNVDELIETIAALPAPERETLFARLREHPELGPELRGEEVSAPSSEAFPDDVHYSIVFDGGSKGNPGQGYGSYALTRCDTGERRIVRCEFPGLVTNNEAEYMTLIEALRTLTEKIREHGKAPGDYKLEVRGDSQLVVNQINDQWKARDDRMRSLRDDARELLDQFGYWRLVHHGREHSVEVLGH